MVVESKINPWQERIALREQLVAVLTPHRETHEGVVDFLNDFKPRQQNALWRQILTRAALELTGRLPGEMISRRPGPRGTLIDYDPLDFQAHQELGKVGIKRPDEHMSVVKQLSRQLAALVSRS